jgi:Ca2+-binding RTX toxin-like protein
LISIESAAGGAGNDTILGSDEANDVSGAGGDDSLQGGAGTDRLNGGEGADILDGGADGDMLIGGSGNDTVFGGLGYDTLILSGAHTDYTFVSNRDGTYTVTDSRAVGDGIDIISSVEQISFSNTTLGLWSLVGFIEIPGTTASERLEGTPGRDFITGDDGDDLLLGFEEEDILSGGRGNDTLNGGLGSIDDSNGIWDTADYIAEFFDGGTHRAGPDLSHQPAHRSHPG